MNLFRVLSLLGLCGATGVQGAVFAEPPYPKTNLVSFLAHWQPTPAALGMVCELSPQWVGTLKRVYLRAAEGLENPDEPNNVRFSHLMVFADQIGRTNLTILRGRITAQGRLGTYLGSEAPAFMSNLPSAKAVAEAKSVDDLRKILGPSLPDLFVGGTWTRFTTEGNGRLRYLGVMAYVSSVDLMKAGHIDMLEVTEGIFRPANPNSAEERREFKTGEELEVEYQAGRAKARAQYPLPLRALVEAKETPEDSDLAAYKRALNEIRRHPSPELFQQFAAWIHEGTCEISGMLGNLMFDNFLKLEQWQEPQRNIALRALTDALPQVKTNRDLDHLVTLLLQAHGTGELRVEIPGGNGVVGLKAERAADGSRSSSTSSSQNITEENLARAAQLCRDALKAQYPELR